MAPPLGSRQKATRKRSIWSWDDPSSWPIDTPDYVFLARAFNDIGRAKFGSGWDRELPPDPDDNDDDDDDSAKGTAAWLKAYELWEKACEEVHAKSAEMRRAVRREIGDLCLSERLRTAVRPERGGALTEVPKGHWNTEPENLDGRFIRCQMSVTHPFTANNFASPGEW